MARIRVLSSHGLRIVCQYLLLLVGDFQKRTCIALSGAISRPTSKGSIAKARTTSCYDQLATFTGAYKI